MKMSESKIESRFWNVILRGLRRTGADYRTISGNWSSGCLSFNGVLRLQRNASKF